MQKNPFRHFHLFHTNDRTLPHRSAVTDDREKTLLQPSSRSSIMKWDPPWNPPSRQYPPAGSLRRILQLDPPLVKFLPIAIRR